MKRLSPLITLDAFMLLILGLMLLLLSIPGCEPPTYQHQPAPAVKEKPADIEIKHGDGRTTIDIDRKDDGGLKINIEKKKDDSDKQDDAQKTQTEPKRRAVPFHSSSVA